ncbi:MAG: formimidoylglutamate deiminase [Acidobacteriaceae bacterium]
MSALYTPELLYMDGAFHRNCGLVISDDGVIQSVGRTPKDSPDHHVELPGKALLPGAVNAHSHSFQRLIRGKAESRRTSGKDFWSWRSTMYHAAAPLSPRDVYDVSRMTFLEMALAGITTVGEFHYLHNAPDGQPYDDPNLLGKQVIAAAQSVGIRIVLLRTAYFRSGYQLPRDPGQIRFFESLDSYIENAQQLINANAAQSKSVQIGVAPHSVRAVPVRDFREITEWARARKLPIHTHLSEQIAENQDCLREHGLTPATLLSREQIPGPDFTAIHSIHITPEEISLLARAGSSICSCPTTERNLGDGIVPVDSAMRNGVRFALGSDSQAQIDPWEDARELDYHLRLQYQQRALLDDIHAQALAERLLACATKNGAHSLSVPAGDLKAGNSADFFTVDLNDVSLAGHSESSLLPLIVFTLSRAAIRDVVAAGRMIIRDGHHPLQNEIVDQYKDLYLRVWKQE